MNGVLCHDSTLLRIYWAGATWANQMNFVMNDDPRCSIDDSTCQPAVQRATTVP